MSADYTGTVVPTLSNAPASSWTSDAAKKSHVNDLYLVTGSGASAGNLYAFEEYAKPLVKNATPGEIVTFADGGDNAPITAASVSLSPIQSLNGYDSPWPGGANINKLPSPVEATQTSDGVTVSVKNGVYTISGTATASHNFRFPLTASVDLSPSTNKIAFLNFVSTSNVYVQFERSGSSVHYWQMVPINRVASGWTDSGNEVIDSVTIRIAATGTYNLTISPMLISMNEANPTTFSPWQNICPISGHTGAELIRTGKNLLPHKFYQFNSSQLCVGTDTATTYVHYLKAGTYTLRASLMGQARWIIREEHDTADTNVGGTLISANPHGTFTIDKDGMYRIWLYGSGITAEMVTWFQLELGSSATSYEPYDGDTYSVTFTDQGTVYGGTYDFVTGKLTVTWASVDLGTFSWTANSSVPRFYTSGISANVARPNQYVVTSAKCSHYKSGSMSGTEGLYSSTTDNLIAVSEGGYVSIKDKSKASMSAADFKTAMSGVQFVYDLVTPLEYTLSPQQLTTLLGQNVVWSDTGPITQLTYTSNQFTPSFDWFETWTVPKITRDNGNVIVLPKPQEYTPEIYDVDAATTGRNAAGTMIRDRVARKHKFNYKFAALSQQDATEILNAVQDVSFTLTTASPETGAKTNYRVYVGDRSLPVYWMPTHATASWMYSNLSLNLIEM